MSSEYEKDQTNYWMFSESKCQCFPACVFVCHWNMDQGTHLKLKNSCVLGYFDRIKSHPQSCTNVIKWILTWRFWCEVFIWCGKRSLCHCAHYGAMFLNVPIHTIKIWPTCIPNNPNKNGINGVSISCYICISPIPLFHWDIIMLHWFIWITLAVEG
jgi:hypothetical protein